MGKTLFRVLMRFRRKHTEDHDERLMLLIFLMLLVFLGLWLTFFSGGSSPNSLKLFIDIAEILTIAAVFLTPKVRIEETSVMHVQSPVEFDLLLQRLMFHKLRVFSKEDEKVWPPVLAIQLDNLLAICSYYIWRVQDDSDSTGRPLPVLTKEDLLYFYDLCIPCISELLISVNIGQPLTALKRHSLPAAVAVNGR